MIFHLAQEKSLSSMHPWLTFGDTKRLASFKIEIALLCVTTLSRYFSFVNHLASPPNHWEQTFE